MVQSSTQQQKKPSFTRRLKAWWNGVDLSEILEEVPEGQESVGRGEKAAQSETKEKLVPASPLQPFENPDIRIKQQIWGKGFYKPGGQDYVLSLVKPFGLNPSMSVVDFGAGLGGSTRSIATEFDVWVVGYEPDAELAKAGKEMSVKAGLEKKAGIIHYVSNVFEPRQSSIDCIVSTETFYLLKDKSELLKVLERALKSRGQIVITDFVRADSIAENDPVLNEFRPKPENPIFLWNNEDYKRRFRELSFDLRVGEDVTEKYRHMILEGWVAFTRAGGEAAANARAYPDALVKEVEMWVRRVAAFDAGQVRLMRYYAIKTGSSMVMSDW